ncbi:14009_t:CDS:2, partial [Acaulospora colombiana]
TSQNSSSEGAQQSKLDDIVCTVCHYGRSPKHNRIVLCDKCDVPYHQQCHVPPIEDRVVEIPTAEWICLRCEEMKGRKRRKVGSRAFACSNNERDVSGSGLTEEQEQIANNAHTPMANNDTIDNRSAQKDSFPHPSAVPQVSSKQSTKSYADSTDPSRAHLPAVGVDLPSYEEMIVQALLSIADPAGQQKYAQRIRRYFKKPQSSNEQRSYKDDIVPEDDQEGVYEIAVRMEDPDNFTSAQGIEMDDHPSVSSSAVSTPAPHAISSGHTEATSPEENSSMDDTSGKIVPVLVNEPSNPMSTMMQNQSILPPRQPTHHITSSPSTTNVAFFKLSGSLF